MTTRKRPPRRQGDDLPCGQKGCYHPETARDLRWCVYANYWRYSCQKPDDMEVVPPPPPKRVPDQEGQIGAPVRIPTGLESDPPAGDPGPQDEDPTLEEEQEQDDPQADEAPAEEQDLEETPDAGDPGDAGTDDADAGASAADDADTQDEAVAYAIPAPEPADQAADATPEPVNSVPEPVKAFQTAFAI